MVGKQFIWNILVQRIRTILEDPAEKCRGLEIIMAQTSDRKWAFTERMANQVEVYRLDVEEFQAKANPPLRK